MAETDELKQTGIDLEAEKAKIESLPVSDKLKEKMKSLLVAELSQSHDSIEIWGKVFSVIKPEVNNKDVFAWPEWYEHVTYVKGTALSREVKKAGKKLFKNIDEAKAFLAKHIPWATEAERIQNFAELLGLGKSGFRNSLGVRSDQGKRGCAWLTEPDRDGAWSLVFSDGRAFVYRVHLGLSLPVVCFQD